MQKRHVRYLRTLGLLAMAGLAPGALGQDAVGNGRALENRLQTRQPGAPLPFNRSFSRELAFREAVVTGTAPGGYSFRGTTLPGQFEFRGELGEDALFSYRRDSLYSGLSGRGIRGTEALQYQFALSVGAQVPTSLAGPISFNRAGGAERSTDPTQPFNRDLSHPGQGIRHASPESDDLIEPVDLSAGLVQPVRSISSFTANRALQPTLVGLMQNRDTQQTSGHTASPLLGVQIVPVSTLRNPDSALQRPNAVNRAAPDSAVPNSAAPGNAAPSNAVPNPTPGTDLPSAIPESAAPESAAPGAATKPRARTAYDSMMERFRAVSGVEDPAALPAAGSTPDWARDLIDLRRTLRGLPPSTAKALGLTPEEPAATEPNAVGRGDNPLLKPAEDPDTPFTFDAEVLRRVREAGGLADTLIAADIPNINRYATHMRTGEQLLAAGRYFDAEERFISALSAAPGDVNAQIGRTHAQIGAGLYLSAALNVRQLLVNAPEISGMRYAEGLLPDRARLHEVVAVLRGGLGSPTSGADSGLLLAYLGHQLEQPDDIRAGLDALSDRGAEEDQRLADMLRGVWLEAEAPTGDDSPADDG